MPKVIQLSNGQCLLTISSIAKLKNWKGGDWINIRLDNTGRVYLERGSKPQLPKKLPKVLETDGFGDDIPKPEKFGRKKPKEIDRSFWGDE